MDNFIKRENLALFKKKLSEPHTEPEHQILLKLQADEEAKGQPAEAKRQFFTGTNPPDCT